MGELIRDGIHICYTLEDEYRGKYINNKMKHHTAIPCGSYKVIVNRSPKYNRKLPLILGVPGFSGVRIHGGNDVDDTSGCPLVGYYRDLTSCRIWGSASDQVTGLISADIEDFGEVHLDVIFSDEIVMNIEEVII